MENRTDTGQVKRILSLKEKIKAKEYFEVLIYHDPLFLIYGDGNIEYEVTSSDMDKALSKALELHHEGWPTDTEGDEPSYITKYKTVRFSDKEILENFWGEENGPSRLIYMEYWEPNITTEDLIELLETNDPNWFEWKAHYVEKVWELDLLEEVMPSNN